MTTLDYTINWSDGSLKSPFTLQSGTLNTTTTSLDLTGRGYKGWGEPLQENLLKLLENFASNGTAPRAPTRGQTWFNSVDQYLNLYTANGWKQLSFRRIDFAAAPAGTHFPGDLWFDTTNDKLKVYGLDGNPEAIVLESDLSTGLSGKQNTLISGTNIKTVNGASLLGSGNLDVTPTLKTVNGTSLFGAGNIDTTQSLKTVNGQTLSGTGNIDTTPALKTLDGQSLFGAGNIISATMGTTWVNVTAQRSVNTWYQNNTGKTIAVSVTWSWALNYSVEGSIDPWIRALRFYINTSPTTSGAVTINSCQVAQNALGIFVYSAEGFALIPPGAYYNLLVTITPVVQHIQDPFTEVNLSKWIELR